MRGTERDTDRERHREIDTERGTDRERDTETEGQR